MRWVELFLLPVVIAVVQGKVCLPGWQAGPGNNCYLFRLTKKSWDDALTVCRGMKSTLASIESSQTQAWIKTSVGKLKDFKSVPKWWVGLSRPPGGRWVWTDGTPFNTSVSPWLPDEPHLVVTSGTTQRLCGQYKFSTSAQGLGDKLCAKEHPFICQRTLDAPSFCDSANGWEAHHGMCYKYIDSKLPWTQARLDCENKGAVLASPQTSTDEQTVSDITTDKRSQAWIGLYAKVTGEHVSWKWADGSAFGNTFWSQKQPITVKEANSSCVTIRPGEDFRTAWSTKDCDEEQNYVCQKLEGFCAPGWKSFGVHCYQFNIQYFLTWDDAVKHCQLQGARLIQIQSKDTQTFVNRYLDQLRRAKIGQLWIGLHDEAGSGVFTWSDKIPLSEYRNFPKDRHIPDGGRTCQFISTAVKTCDENWISADNSGDNHCYLFNETEVTWSEARQTCQSRGGDLVSVTDRNVQGFINEHFDNSKWIGLNDLKTEGRLVWLDETNQPTFFNMDAMAKNDKSENCAFVAGLSVGGRPHLGHWVLTGCDSTHGFICQKSALNSAGALTTPKVRLSTQVGWTSGCGPGWEQHHQVCFMFREEQKSWADARATCKQNGGDLTSITDGMEQSYITGRVSSLTTPWLWIGAQDLAVEGGWQWADNSPLGYSNWNTGEPDNRGNSDCAALYRVRGTWDDFSCDTQHGFICKRPAVLTQPTGPTTPISTVPDGWAPGCDPGWRHYNNHCYSIKHSSQNWVEARKACLQQDADLVSVHDVGEENFIYSLTMPGLLVSLWLGLNSRRTPRTYEWSDNSAFTYVHWGRGEPNNQAGGSDNCVVANTYGRGYWVDVDCDLPSVYGFICKKSQVLRPTGTPHVDIGCSQNWAGYGTTCYFFVESPKTFNDAEAQCKQFSGHLAVVNDRYVQAFLTSELGSRSGYFWIGLHTVGSMTSSWTEGTPLRYTNWDRSHTGNEGSSCVTMRADRPIGLWLNKACSDARPFICQAKRNLPSSTGVTSPSTTPADRCPYRYNMQYNGSCYKLVSHLNGYTWWEGLAVCQRDGAHLLSLQNRQEVDWVKKYVIRYYYRHSYWIGLNALDPSRGYNWEDDTPFTYAQWNHGEPNNHNDQEDCVEWNTQTNVWADFSCYARRGLVCEYTKGASHTRPTVPPATEPPISCGTAPHWQYYNGSCYYFIRYSAVKSWFLARDYCQNTIGGELVSIGSPEENNFVLSMISKNGGYFYWIGLNELNLGLEWSDGSPVAFINWAINEPNDDYGGQKCTMMLNGDGFWYDANCAQTASFICKQVNGTRNPVSRTPTPQIPGNCLQGWHSYGNKCYKVFAQEDQFVNWTTAETKCRGLGKGFDLVGISTQPEQLFLTSLLQGVNGSCWIGVHQKTGYRKFLRTDNFPVTYTNWDKGEPNGRLRPESRRQDCVEIRPHLSGVGKWADTQCAVPQGYICQGHKDPSLPVAVTTPVPDWCAAGYTVYGGSCYRILHGNYTWWDAYKTCIANGSNLVSLTDPYEQNFVQLLALDVSQPVWIGLSDRQLKGIYRWSDGWPVSYSRWGRGEPSRGADEGCAALQTDGTWEDTGCEDTYPAVCQIRPGTPPPFTTPVPGYCRKPEWTKFRGYCYLVGTSAVSWPEAQFNCKQNGMRLATLHDQDETDFAVKLIGERHLRYDVWIGMVNAERAGFRWADGSPVSYTNWGENEPSNSFTKFDEDCVQIQRSSGQWDDRACHSRKYSLCMTEMVTPTVSSGTTSEHVSSTRPVHGSTSGATQNLITGATQNLITGATQNLITRATQNSITGATQNFITGTTPAPKTAGASLTPTTGATQRSKKAVITPNSITGATQDSSIPTTTQKLPSRTTNKIPPGTANNLPSGTTKNLPPGTTYNLPSGTTKNLPPVTNNKLPLRTTQDPEPISGSHSPPDVGKSRAHQPQPQPGGLGAGAIGGICVAVVLAVSIATLVVVYSRKRGYFGLQTSVHSVQFDNALYNHIAADRCPSPVN